MIKCLECGFETQRLQWTHFKYKCNGRYNSINDYKKAYPLAPTVDPDLAKRAVVTLESLTAKYGETIGQERWDRYRAKQSESNTFEYKRKRHGWTQDQFHSYNKSRAATVAAFISRHGEETGTLMWQEYCARQAYTNTVMYFIDRYGEEAGTQRYKEINRKKAHTVESLLGKGYTEKDAEQYFLNKGNRFYSQLEIEIIKDIEQQLGTTLAYTIATKQYCVYGNGKVNFYDIVHNNRCLEIHGDYWHCNPHKYPENYYHGTIGMTARDIWERDKNKITLLFEKRNIPTLVVWETDYRTDKTSTIGRCVSWILGENL